VARTVNARSRSACSHWTRSIGEQGLLRRLLLPTGVLTALALGGALAGCVIVSDDDHDDDWDDGSGSGSYEPPPADDPVQVGIDTGRAVDAEPGEGVGVFVEYAEGGVWRLWTSCDTTYSGATCEFDIQVTVDDGSELLSVGAEDLEDGDQAGAYDEFSGFLQTDTTDDADGVRFETTPGAVLRVDTFLDGQAQPRFVYWVGDDVVHAGAPTNPVDFVPSAP